MRIFVSGIGGVGMGSLALLAHDAQYEVYGSDVAQSLTTHELEDTGITISYEQTGASLRSINSEQAIDWYIYTAALPGDHPELQAAKELGIRTSKRDEFLTEFIKTHNLKLIAVAGTHGKTTTTAMMIWALQQLNIPISYSVGSQLPWGPSGLYKKNSEYFVYECDEFDRNFLHFHPYLSLLPSIDYDHPDTYPTESDYLSAFKQFGNQSRQIVCWQYEHGELFVDHSDAWILQDIDIQNQLKLAGSHTRSNATLVRKALEKLDITCESNVIETFPGVARRMEKLGDNLYTDYGHHPREIAATLTAAKELNSHVMLVYQPHQNVRQHEVREQYTNDVFKDADAIYWLPTYQSREDQSLPLLRPEDLSKNVEAVRIANMDSELWDIIQKARDENILVLCMGAGSIDGWVRNKLIED